ncbi:MAG: hypothetical protein D6824_07960, partial [Planctomycetota bacterium]
SQADEPCAEARDDVGPQADEPCAEARDDDGPQADEPCAEARDDVGPQADEQPETAPRGFEQPAQVHLDERPSRPSRSLSGL